MKTKERNTEKSHLLFVVNTTGSFISHRLPIAQEAIKSGYKVSLATGDVDSHEDIKLAGINHYHLPLVRSGRSLIGECHLIFAIFKLIKTLKPDIIHNVNMKPVLYTGLINRFIGKRPCVNAITGLGFIFIREGWMAKIMQRIILCMYYVSNGCDNSIYIFQNSDDLNLFIQKGVIPLEKTCLMKGVGVSLNEYSVSSTEYKDELIRILFPARLLRDKGIVELVEAVKILAKKYSLKLLIAGGIDKDNPTSISQSQWDEWQKETCIEFLGHQSNMASIYQDSHIVCLPSYREGMPRALLEAQACGCPVITTNVPGCREAIVSGKTGLLVKRKSISELVEAIDNLIQNKELRKKMGTAARQHAEKNFSVENIIRETLSLYADILSPCLKKSKKVTL